LYCYDEKHPEGCYSFRRGYGAHKAIYQLANIPNISNMWCYKLDIHDYFNSISIPILLPILKEIIDDDIHLYNFFEKILIEDKAYYEEKIIEESRGIMAGTPISPFFANIYLKEIDTYFKNEKIPYARYSDDIILFANNKEDLDKYKNKLISFLKKYKLTINPKKEKEISPNESWEYLGIEYKEGNIDLSVATKDKLKGKIRRKARSIRRWMLKRQATEDKGMRVMIKVFNRKFFETGIDHELTWSRWFFPIVTVKNGFEEIDNYLQQYIRYIPTGKHNKKNYKTKYSDLKELGYRSLVNEYYKFKNSII